MSLGNRLFLPVILLALAVLAGCGSSNSNPVVTPPPTGGFDNSHLNGTYVFSVVGTDVNYNWVAVAGTFTADGNGNITQGVLDQNSTAPGNPIIALNVNSGTYTVGPDGRPDSLSGILTLQTDIGPFGFDFVLSSSQHGLITEFDSVASASGTFDLQSNVSPGIGGQSYAFNFAGTSGVGTVVCNINFGSALVVPLATVGAFTLDGSGNITAGLQDFNDNCFSDGLTNLPITAGSVSLATVPGTAVINTDQSSLNFDVFPVDATHMKFIEVDAEVNFAGPILVGDAFTQTNSIPTGNNVFTLSGFDSSLQAPFVTAGILSTDGSGNVTSSSAQDLNDSGNIDQVTSGITGNYTSVTGGRAVLTLTSGFINGNAGAACSFCQFAAYPSIGGLQLLEIDDGGLTGGVAYPQSNTTLASGEGYGANFTGFNFNVGLEEDDIAEFTNNNGVFGPGIIDVNQQGLSVNFKNTFSSTFVADTTVPGRGVVSPGANAYPLVTYTVDGSTAVAVSTDFNYIALGSFSKQNASAKSNIATAHLAALRLKPVTHKESRRKAQ